ncbi:MAG: hypothetical protein Ct9H90mP16_02270 [Candidatus Poseidoniales archaeon]|nr:MAG: hypothetical protein Ct9H90mP16_02270 [Candidatus Poseidoniales archaeon]
MMPKLASPGLGLLRPFNSPMSAALQGTGIMDVTPSQPPLVDTATMRRGYSRAQSI